MVTIGQPMEEIEIGWKRYDDTNVQINYQGSGWAIYTSFAGKCGEGTHYHSSPSAPTYIEFSFIGSKIRVYGVGYTGVYTHNVIVIDGVSYDMADWNSLVQNTVSLSFEKVDLSYGQHSVQILYGGSSRIYLDAIDIDDTGRLSHLVLNEVFDLHDMAPGKCIRCHYTALSNNFGVFTGLGQETSDLIPIESSATPDGDFYWVCVGYDTQGRMKLVADRIIQHSISWDILNSMGVVEGNSKMPLPLKMTSNNSPSPYIVSASSYYSSGYEPYKLFNGALGSGNEYCSVKGGIPCWIKIDLGASVSLVGYSIYPVYTDVSSYSPKDWTFEGSNNDIDWVILDTRTNVTDWVLNTWKEFNFENQIAYRYYRLNISSGTGESIQFGELELIAQYPGVIRLLSGGVSSSDKDNEWDKIIVESDLGGNIVPGDNNIWNWDVLIREWTSTTPSGGTGSRVLRGCSLDSSSPSGISAYTTASSSESTNTRGFRPILRIEKLFSPPSVAILENSLNIIKLKLFDADKDTFKYKIDYLSIDSSVKQSLINQETFVDNDSGIVVIE